MGRYGFTFPISDKNPTQLFSGHTPFQGQSQTTFCTSYKGFQVYTQSYLPGRRIFTTVPETGSPTDFPTLLSGPSVTYKWRLPDRRSSVGLRCTGLTSTVLGSLHPLGFLEVFPRSGPLFTDSTDTKVGTEEDAWDKLWSHRSCVSSFLLYSGPWSLLCRTGAGVRALSDVGPGLLLGWDVLRTSILIL